jgi:U4/U6 small nuclear ribonucleoprotein PRP3
MVRKHIADKEKQCCRALFRIDTEVPPQHKFNINKNAKQYHLAGVFVTNDPKYAPHLQNFVLIEGGHRTVTKYKRLMLRRIKWVE